MSEKTSCSLYFHKDPNSVGKSKLSYPICCYWGCSCLLWCKPTLQQLFQPAPIKRWNKVSHLVYTLISSCCSLLRGWGESMFILLWTNQAQPVKKHTDSPVEQPPPLQREKKVCLLLSDPEVVMCSFFVLLLVEVLLKRRLGRQRAQFFYSHKTHSELQNTPNEGVQRCHVRHASFYQAG